MDVPPGQVVLVPVEERGVSTRAAFTGTPTNIPGKTGKASVPYSIVVVPDDGSPAMMVPGVFLPDIESYSISRNVPTPDEAQAAADAAAATELQASQEMMRDFQTREEADLEQLMNPFPQPGQ